MNAAHVWFGNEAWPSGASPGAFARDVFRLENCKTDKQRALAFNKWFIRCMLRGQLAFVPGFGGMIRTFNPLHIFLWGSCECTGWGWVATEALQAAGMKARRAVVKNSGHTFYEVWYAGDDGKEGWHAFDPYKGWYFTNDRGEVASLEELNANPDLSVHPRPGCPARIGHHPERSTVDYAYHCADALDIEQPVQNDEALYFPQIGQSYSTLWRPETPDLRWTKAPNPDGLVCDIAMFDEEGKPRYPEHWPYWKNYAWPSPHRGGQVVRWGGCGALRWQPLLYGEAAAVRAHNAIFENGTLRPSGPNKHCEVWYHIRLPYIATYLRLNPFANAIGSDLIGFAVSPDNGKSIEPIAWGGGVPDNLLTWGTDPNGKSIRGMREFWLRIDMSSKSSASPLRLQQLHVTVGYHANMHMLPRLLPGKNDLYLQAKELSGAKLVAEWNFSHPKGERSESLALDKSGRANRALSIDVEQPDELVMRGVTLRCLPK